MQARISLDAIDLAGLTQDQLEYLAKVAVREFIRANPNADIIDRQDNFLATDFVPASFLAMA